MDLKPYLNRIQYDGPLAPTIAVLRDIQLAHACSIPFENLDVLLDRGNAGDVGEAGWIDRLHAV